MSGSDSKADAAGGGKDAAGAAPEGASRFQVVVAVDGSEVSHRAFMAAARLHQRGDLFTVVHATDITKKYLPFDLQPEHLRTTYETLMVSRFPSSDYSMEFIPRKTGQAVKDVITSYVNKEQSQLLIIGFTGRKGPKDDPTVLGSTTDSSLRAANCSILVVKRRPEITNDPMIFAAAVDGSSTSFGAFLFVARMAREGDIIYLVHVEEDSDTGSVCTLEGLTQQYERLCKDGSCTTAATVKVKRIPKHKSCADTICEFVEEQEVALLAVGVDGMTAASSSGRAGILYGSVSDRVVRNARCSVLAYKPVKAHK